MGLELPLKLLLNLEKLDFAFPPSPYTDPYLTLHSDVITTGKPNTERKLTDRETTASCFSVGSKL